jgi:hypothetical protein
MSAHRPLPTRVKQFPQQRDWSEGQLAERPDISRMAESAVEIQELAPSIAVALARAGVFGAGSPVMRFCMPFKLMESESARKWRHVMAAVVFDPVPVYPAVPTIASHRCADAVDHRRR